MKWLPEESFGSDLPVYFKSSYLKLFAHFDHLQYKMLEISKDNQVLRMVFILRPIDDEYFEASTVYGYGGLFTTSSEILSLEEIRLVQSFLASEKIVCAFIRHSPFLKNQILLNGESDLNRKTYATQLDSQWTLDSYCSQVDQKLRWSINYARRHGLKVEFYPGSQWNTDDVNDFYSIYAELMQAKQTQDFYLFSEDFFHSHGHAFGDECELALIRDPESTKVIAAAFFLLDSTGWVHYHLSASLRDFLKKQPVELLMAEAIVRYGQMGMKNIHFGGGHCLDESDGLSRFKKKFSDQTLEFHLSKWICDPENYQRLRDEKPLQNPSFFLIHDARGAL